MQKELSVRLIVKFSSQFDGKWCRLFEDLFPKYRIWLWKRNYGKSRNCGLIQEYFFEYGCRQTENKEQLRFVVPLNHSALLIQKKWFPFPVIGRRFSQADGENEKRFPSVWSPSAFADPSYGCHEKGGQYLSMQPSFLLKECPGTFQRSLDCFFGMCTGKEDRFKLGGSKVKAVR